MLKTYIAGILSAGAYPNFKRVLEAEMKNGGEFRTVVKPLKSMRSCIVQFSCKNPSFKTEITELGVDTDEAIAYQKAFIEYYERKAYLLKGLSLGFDSTNGIAGHSFKNLAKQSACNEVFERDSFLRHWYQQAPFSKENPRFSQVDAIKQELKEKGYDLFFGSTSLGYKKAIVCFIVNKKTRGFVVGLACGQKDEYQKAMDEAIINLFYGDKVSNLNIRLEKIKKKGIKELQDHRAYWLYLKPMPDWISDLNYSEEKTNYLDVKDIREYHLETEGVHVVGVKIKNTLPLVVGKLSAYQMETSNQENINIKSSEYLIHPIP